MRLNRRRLLAISGIAAGVFAGCTAPSNDTPTEQQANPPTETPSPTATATRTPTSTGLDGEIAVKGSEWTLVPDGFEARVDQPLTITFENIGEVAHNLTVGMFPADERPVAEQAEEETFMAKTDTIQSNDTTTVTFTPASIGTFPYWCDVPGHREAGMLGEMTVVK